MKFKILSVVCALTIAGAFTQQALAGEVHTVEEHQVKVVVAGGGDAEVIQLDGDDLEVGESRQIITEDGKEVVITRTESGFEVTVDGESLDLPPLHGHGTTVDIDVEGDGHHKVIRKVFTTTAGEGDANAVFVVAGDEGHGETFDIKVKKVGGHAMAFVTEDGKTVQLDGLGDVEWHAEGGLAEHLKESGALDDLTEEQKAKVLDALKSFAPQHRVMVLKTDEEHPGEEH